MRENAAEKGQQILQVLAQSPEIRSDVEVRDSIRRQGEELRDRGPDPDLPAGDVFEFHRDVAQLQRRQDVKVLFCLLLGLEAHRILDDSCAVGAGERRLDRRQTFQLLAALSLFQVGVGNQREQTAVLVVQHLGRDQVLEVAALFPRRLEILEVGIEVDRGVGVTAVLVRAEKVEQHLERVRKACVGTLSLLELEAMDGGVDLGCIHSVL